jgi:hypothetical protein
MSLTRQHINTSSAFKVWGFIYDPALGWWLSKEVLLFSDKYEYITNNNNNAHNLLLTNSMELSPS